MIVGIIYNVEIKYFISTSLPILTFMPSTFIVTYLERYYIYIVHILLFTQTKKNII